VAVKGSPSTRGESDQRKRRGPRDVEEEALRACQKGPERKARIRGWLPEKLACEESGISRTKTKGEEEIQAEDEKVRWMVSDGK